MRVTLMIAFAVRVQSSSCYGSWLGYCTALQDSLCASQACSVIKRCKATSKSSSACLLATTVFTVILYFIVDGERGINNKLTANIIIPASRLLLLLFIFLHLLLVH